MAPGLASIPFWEKFGPGPVILDGGLATELERRGADLRDPLWSAKLLLENPTLIRQVHEAYVAAGADVVTTATYQLSFEGFARRGLERAQTVEAIRLSVRLAREAGPKLVAASVGPYGAFLADGSEFRGDYGLSVQQLIDWHRPRLEALADSGADLLACETIPCQAEAEALVRLLEDFPRTPAWFSFSCRNESLVSHGETLAACAAIVNHCPNAVAFGVNCTAPQFVEGLLQSVAGVARKPLLAYPNLGGVWDGKEHVWRGGEDWDWAAAASRWLAAGARFIGGCCRTTPAHIQQIAALRVPKE
ncbi:MAG TPA: homocysteine S-methyltransferase [Gemmataceae bacterium]|nr:homocysteine S-methyltransferase [Gemmataceae bacterium]